MFKISDNISMENKLSITYLILIGIIFLLITCYIIINHYKKLISDNWVQYRCNPLVMPFASILGKNTIKNYQFCLWTIMKSFFSHLLKPVLYIYNLIFKNIENMSNTLNVVRKQIFSIRGFIIKYIQDLLARIENFSVTLRKTLIKINDILQKQHGIVVVAQYIVLVMVYIMQWFWNILRTIVLTIIIVSISLSFIIWLFFPVYGTILLILTAGAGISYSCFAPQTPITLNNLTNKMISKIELGDLLYDNNRVLGIIETLPNYYNLYKLDNIIVSGDHLVHSQNEIEKWIRVKDHPNITQTKNRFDIEKLYCLITSKSLIHIQNIEFGDYIEYQPNNIEIKNIILNFLNNTNDSNVTPNQEIGMFGFTNSSHLLLKNNTSISINHLKIGDMLINGDIVTAIIKIKLIPDIKLYRYKNNIIVSGGQIVKENNKWICVYQSKYSSLIEKPEYDTIYHINTISNTITINDILFTDFMEITDKMSNQQIDSLNLSKLNN